LTRPTPARAGELLGVRVLDHVIIGKGRFVSFVDDGYW
jgi:DNA repair protein RadC